MDETDPDLQTYKVVRNDEEQYSIWPAARTIPPGWTATRPAASKQECLAHIAEVWTDMRPLSLRRRMAAAAEQAGATE